MKIQKFDDFSEEKNQNGIILNISLLVKNFFLFLNYLNKNIILEQKFLKENQVFF